MPMQLNNNPRISVAMGTLFRRDSLDLLRRSVDSILTQTVSDFEFLICDDGSTTEAVEYLNSVTEHDPRIRMVRPGSKTDLASKLNACLCEARGSYIARMDDDDFSLPNRFEKQLQVLNAEPDVAFVGCNVRLFQDEKLCGIRRLPEYPQIRDFFMTQPYIHPTLMFRREALETVNGYSEDTHQILCEDYDLLLRLYAKGYNGKNIQDELLDYTIPADGKSNRKLRHRWNESVTRLMRFKELGVLPKALPYVVKPLAVGMIPNRILLTIKKNQNEQLFNNTSIS